MIDHISTYSTNFDDTRRFYEAAMGALGHELQMETVASWDTDFPERRMCGWGPGRPVFWLVETRERCTPRHFAFSAGDRPTVNAFHAAVLAIGAPDQGAPGPRPVYHENYYGAFALDPDGNNVEAVCHAPV